MSMTVNMQFMLTISYTVVQYLVELDVEIFFGVPKIKIFTNLCILDSQMYMCVCVCVVIRI